MAHVYYAKSYQLTNGKWVPCLRILEDKGKSIIESPYTWHNHLCDSKEEADDFAVSAYFGNGRSRP